MLRTSLMLDEELVRFLQGGCALIVCTLDPDGEPFVVAGVGAHGAVGGGSGAGAAPRDA